MNIKTIMAVTMATALVCGSMEGAESKSRAEVIDAVAVTLWGEARGEGFDGLFAVASVIYNRAHGNADKFYAVVTRPKQFSCWNSGTPKVVRRNAKDDKAWRWCVKLATAMVDGSFTPNTEATHYCTTNCHPRWAKRLTWVETKGKHKFYK